MSEQQVEDFNAPVEDEELVWLPLSEIFDDENNVRKTYTEIEELAGSIRANGLLQPIVVRRSAEGKHIIIMGHRRKRALLLNAEYHHGPGRVRVIVRHKELLSDDVLAQMLSENMSRVGLDPIEEARGLRKLQAQRNLSEMDVARQIGATQTWVSARLRLLDLSPEDQAAVSRRKMSIGAGVRKARVGGGNVRPGAVGKTNGSFLSSTHPLASKVARRCESLNHKRGPNSVGGIGCGVCWDAVIRTDERRKLSEAVARTGDCSTCGSHVEKTAEEQTEEVANNE